MMRPFAVLLVLGLLVSGAAAQTKTSTKGMNEIHQLYLNDQAERGVVPPGTKAAEVTPEQMAENDAARRKRAHQLMEQGMLKTGEDFHDAAFIFQHGYTPEDYLLGHVLATAAVAKGDIRSRWIAAATLDRYLMSVGQDQVFGTQFITPGFLEIIEQARTKREAEKAAQKQAQAKPDKEGSTLSTDKSKPEAQASNAVDEKWTQSPYNVSLVSDALRHEFCVSGIDDQKLVMAELNGGKKAVIKPIPGCSK